MKACTETGILYVRTWNIQPYGFSDRSSAATYLHFDDEAPINLSESLAPAQLDNPPLLLLARGPSAVHTGEVRHDVTLFSGSPL